MRRRTLPILCLLLLALQFSAAPLHAQVTRTPQGTTLNFQDADLAFVLYALAQAAGVNYAANDLPQKPITLRTTTPLTQAQLLALIRNLAETNGVTVAEAGGVMRFQGSGQSPIEDPRQLFIHKLRHARAPVLASTLQALFSGGISTPRPTAGGGNNQALAAQLQQLQQQQAQRAQQVIVSGGQILNPFGVTIVPDEVTNSLLIRATPAEYQVMQQAIQGLDLRPLQVVIETVIVEVTHGDNVNVGVSVSGDRARGDRTTEGGLPGTQSETDFFIRYTVSGDINLDATLSALASSTRARVLSRPLIHAQNNQEAAITVGEQRPFIQVSRPTGIPGQVGEDVVQYRNVATALTITPTINNDGYVNMAVVQNVDQVTGEVQFGAPVIGTRNATTQILARDGQTVVIGGLIDRRHDRTRGGIPFLKDIPLLGYLFGSTRENERNVELFIFLTPHIVMSDEDADRIKRELENNAELLQPLVPVRSIIPPVIRPIRPDTIRPDTVRGGW
jgi:type II secretory pathway component GspD/PulD (secretin)